MNIATTKSVAFCPHCGHPAPQRLLHKQDYLEPAWSGKQLENVEYYNWSMFVAICETCNRILLYENMGNQFEGRQFTRSYLAYPKDIYLDAVVPSKIAAIYEEAAKIREFAPNAFATQVRRALEAVCHDKGYTTGTLKQKLDKLSDSGIIPPALSEMTDILRLLGNTGAHESDKEIHPLLVSSIDYFFNAIVEYVYVAPQKIRALRSSLDLYTKTSHEG